MDGRFIGRLNERLDDKSGRRLINWMVGWLVNWMEGWLVNWMEGWLVDWMRLVG